jgi:hypothetical protein
MYKSYQKSTKTFTDKNMVKYKSSHQIPIEEF